MQGRWQTLAVLIVTVLWQIYVVAASYSHAGMFRQLFAGLGAEVPLMTRAFFVTVPFWFVIPLLFAALTVDVARRPSAPAWYVAVLTGVSLSAVFSLDTSAT